MGLHYLPVVWPEATSFKSNYARTAVQCPWPHGRPLSSIRDSWTLTGKSGSVPCGITAPFSWVLVHTRFCLCPPRVWCTSLLSPVLWKFYNQIPLAFKVKFPGGSQSLWWIPRLGYLLWALELSQQCKSFFGIIALLFVGCRSVALWCVSQVCCSQSPWPHSRPLLTCASAGDTQTLTSRSGSVSCGVPGSWCTQGFFWTLQESLADTWFDSKCNFPLLLSCWGFSFALKHAESVFGGIQHFSVNGCSAANGNFGVLTEDELTSFYSAILFYTQAYTQRWIGGPGLKWRGLAQNVLLSPQNFSCAVPVSKMTSQGRSHAWCLCVSYTA